MNPANMFRNSDDIESYKAGTTIFSKGDVGSHMYIVMSGEVDVLSDGNYIRTLGEGDLFGEMALIDNSPRSADIVVKTDCTVVPVDERRFLFLVHETPMFALHVLGVMAERLRGQIGD